MPTGESNLPNAHNHLLHCLPDQEQHRLLKLFEPVQMVLSDVLDTAGEPTGHVYFPTDGFISLLAEIEGHAGLEVGMIGREGMLGVHLAMNVATAPFKALVQGNGVALRMGTKVFLQELVRCKPLRQVMNQYMYVTLVQTATSAACLHFHQIGARLARWLLMSHDRANADTFHVTHEFLAYMLGVRRVGITAAAGQLQQQGLITYHRGELTVLDRAGLLAAACGCYAADQKVYANQLRCSTVQA